MMSGDLIYLKNSG